VRLLGVQKTVIPVQFRSERIDRAAGDALGVVAAVLPLELAVVAGLHVEAFAQRALVIRFQRRLALILRFDSGLPAHQRIRHVVGGIERQGVVDVCFILALVVFLVFHLQVELVLAWRPDV